jgi:hypothetical protein
MRSDGKLLATMQEKVANGMREMNDESRRALAGVALNRDCWLVFDALAVSMGNVVADECLSEAQDSS